ncbi:MAG: glycoside hydrolase family 3 C-terminal domain-containing protein [Promethearchaeota archaeon]
MSDKEHFNEFYDDLSSLPFWDPTLDLEERVDDLINRLTLEEKISLSSGVRLFYTKKIKRLGIPNFKMTDGPHGVGATGTFFRGKYTGFPVGICRTATWNRNLAEKFGIAAAEEVRAAKRHCILGPGVNILRTPLCGRNFEYQTEDPFLNKEMVVPIIKGIQCQRISACVKHYAANNQEHNRFTVNAIISERALMEIYLPAFEAAVREAGVWSVMSCYNRVNGKYGAEHPYLLREKLLNEWGFKGFIVSDWFATRNIKDTAAAVKAGLTLEMPMAIIYKKKKLLNAIKAGKISEELLSENLKGFLKIMFLTGVFDDKDSLPKGCKNTPEHQTLARQIAEEGIVLLKNKDRILPLDINKIKRLAVIGPNAKKKHIFGGGSSMQRPKYEITPFKGIKKKCKGKIQIIKEPSEADLVILVVGLNHKKHMDRENKDRLSLGLPDDQIDLINNTFQKNPKTIVVLVNGGPIAMEGWIDKVPAIVEAWYGGIEAGNALANVLFGDVNPSGKLPTTFPKKIEDSPAHASPETYPGDKDVLYKEGIFVGYRHFDKENIEPLFPFGFGLSYTTFKYENLKLNSTSLSSENSLKISVDIANTGKRDGAEIVQLYIQDLECSVGRPIKELKGFDKIFLKTGEKKTIDFEIDKADLCFYDEKERIWKVENGEFKILIGSSSRDIKLESIFTYTN